MRALLGLAALSVLPLALIQAPAGLGSCPVDSVRSGTVCIDKYEASVWYVPRGEKVLISRIQKGTVTLDDLLETSGVTQLGLVYGGADVAAHCPRTAAGCLDVYAVSVPDVTPSRWVNWFQAVAIARNSLKRLPTNQEWQAAAFGTPAAFPCNVIPEQGGFWKTGSEAGCVSDVGAFDMVGNSGELVAEWGEAAEACVRWPAEFNSDLSCVGGSGSNSRLPAQLLRGGYFGGNTAGVFSVNLSFGTYSGQNTWGFRGAR